jgi:hypothetical protein
MLTAAVIILVALLLLSLYGMALQARRYEYIVNGLGRIESAIGSEEWACRLREVNPSLKELALTKDGIMDRLERIESAVDPMARARLLVRTKLRELEAEMAQDNSVAYQHMQVTRIEEALDANERPDRQAWADSVFAPYPWGETDPPNNRSE